MYKGRQKKTVEYVAIKRVDKAQMDRVVNEVQVMHRLNSPHTLRFHNWYETRNNLWLILEYCTGGDLLSLLKQDGKLPEAAVKVKAALQRAQRRRVKKNNEAPCPRTFIVFLFCWRA